MSPSTATTCEAAPLTPLTLDRAGCGPHPRPPLASSVAVVTGGGRGIGRLVASALADAGAAVGLIGRSEAELADTVHEIEAEGGTAAATIADVTDAAAVSAAVTDLQRRLGPVDLLVNNAGIVGPIGPLWEVDADDWWNTFDVNLRGILLCSQAVLPSMIARRRGRIINLSSYAGVHRWPLVSGYSVSKAAVTKLSENLAHETAQYGVRVFSVHPGLLSIGMSETIAAHQPTTAHEDRIRRWTIDSLEAGAGAEPSQALDLILRLAAGDGDPLSGRHLSVHDDLDDLLVHLPEVQDRDLYVLRPEPLRRGAVAATPTPVPDPAPSVEPGQPRPWLRLGDLISSSRPRARTSGPAYYLGRPASVWQHALDR